jgi:hypothetical protein
MLRIFAASPSGEIAVPEGKSRLEKNLKVLRSPKRFNRTSRIRRTHQSSST